MPACLVTGGSRGIGAATAVALAAKGHRVAVSGRDRAAAEAVVSSLPGSGHAVVLGDVADPAVAREVVDTTVRELGDLDVVIASAGVFTAHPITDTSYDEWRRAWRDTLALNLEAPANLAWLAADHWRRRPAGPAGARIITVGSRGAFRGEPKSPAYGASKAGLHAMTQSLALALGTLGVVAVAVAPGWVMTDMAAARLEGPAGDSAREQSPFGRVAEPGEVADVIAWLATDAPEWVSGSVIDVNGASYLR